MASQQKAGRAISLLVSIGLVTGCAAQVAAAKHAAAVKRGAPEMCFGVARAGRNDCRTAVHICAGWAHKDADPGAYVYVPAGTCERIVGGLRDAAKH
jgi:uncharacterized membrane protein